MKDGDREVLPLHAAIDLAQALVGTAAASAGVRALFIKGPVANAHKIRLPRVSSDVDVLVHPQDLTALQDELFSRGWVVRPESFAHQSFVTHSVTLLHDQWPCDIDIHRSFPGFLLEDEEVFEILWGRRQEIVLAKVVTFGADLTSSIVIAALHALRAMYLTRHSEEFDQVAAAVHQKTDMPNLKEEVRSLAIETGATGPLAPFLEALGMTVSRDQIDSPRYLEWQRNTLQLNRSASWLAAILEVSAAERPRYVWRAIFPGVADLLLDHPMTPRTKMGVIHTWAVRLLNALRALPMALRSVHSERRNPGRAKAEGVPTSLGQGSQSGGQSQGVAVNQEDSIADRFITARASGETDRAFADGLSLMARPARIRRALNVAEVSTSGALYLLPVGSPASSTPLAVTGTGLAVWSLVQEPTRLGELVERLADAYGVDPEDVQSDVAVFVQRLVDARVVEVI